uniref:Uncharacterized protein n=1 Tax=Chromera velia CCMP2878 TaxID=1169474 RepID=A0A0G4HYA7_9ALVE|eukprot:Cvel_33485.t1-p1 / transcript=Cvel_33485.t1 / gene=Cvel_33485 / organism=Chromera_velia_CCMP2878 / gene_product=hypothetical protein / transcript_product=hypothetical protein / location=Cvel_scaffold5451:1389-4435(+) / protein_length=935 / sequence_SO=supercontig / SO=protein_coding / is_pseudo=false
MAGKNAVLAAFLHQVEAQLKENGGAMRVQALGIALRKAKIAYRELGKLRDLLEDCPERFVVSGEKNSLQKRGVLPLAVLGSFLGKAKVPRPAGFEDAKLGTVLQACRGRFVIFEDGSKSRLAVALSSSVPIDKSAADLSSDSVAEAAKLLTTYSASISTKPAGASVAFTPKPLAPDSVSAPAKRAGASVAFAPKPPASDSVSASARRAGALLAGTPEPPATPSVSASANPVGGSARPPAAHSPSAPAKLAGLPELNAAASGGAACASAPSVTHRIDRAKPAVQEAPESRDSGSPCISGRGGLCVIVDGVAWRRHDESGASLRQVLDCVAERVCRREGSDTSLPSKSLFLFPDPVDARWKKLKGFEDAFALERAAFMLHAARRLGWVHVQTPLSIGTDGRLAVSTVSLLAESTAAVQELRASREGAGPQSQHAVDVVFVTDAEAVRDSAQGPGGFGELIAEGSSCARLFASLGMRVAILLVHHVGDQTLDSKQQGWLRIGEVPGLTEWGHRTNRLFSLPLRLAQSESLHSAPPSTDEESPLSKGGQTQSLLPPERPESPRQKQHTGHAVNSTLTHRSPTSAPSAPENRSLITDRRSAFSDSEEGVTQAPVDSDLEQAWLEGQQGGAEELISSNTSPDSEVREPPQVQEAGEKAESRMLMLQGGAGGGVPGREFSAAEQRHAAAASSPRRTTPGSSLTPPRRSGRRQTPGSASESDSAPYGPPVSFSGRRLRRESKEFKLRSSDLPVRHPVAAAREDVSQQVGREQERLQMQRSVNSTGFSRPFGCGGALLPTPVSPALELGRRAGWQPRAQRQTKNRRGGESQVMAAMTYGASSSPSSSAKRRSSVDADNGALPAFSVLGEGFAEQPLSQETRLRAILATLPPGQLQESLDETFDERKSGKVAQILNESKVAKIVRKENIPMWMIEEHLEDLARSA